MTAPFPAAPGVRTPADAANAARSRGYFHTDYHPGGLYNDDWEETRWTRDPAGPTVISQHAPMFDVDYPTTAAHTATGTILRIKDLPRRDLRRLRRGLKHLVAAGHVTADAVPGIRASIVDAAASRGTRPVVVPLTMRVDVTRSTTAGHTHLWVQQTMPFDTARRFARALGFVDRRYIRVCARSNRWQLNSPA